MLNTLTYTRRTGFGQLFRIFNFESTQLSGATFGLASSEVGVVRAQIRFRSDISPLESVGCSFPARLTNPSFFQLLDPYSQHDCKTFYAISQFPRPSRDLHELEAHEQQMTLKVDFQVDVALKIEAHEQQRK